MRFLEPRRLSWAPTTLFYELASETENPCVFILVSEGYTSTKSLEEEHSDEQHKQAVSQVTRPSPVCNPTQRGARPPTPPSPPPRLRTRGSQPNMVLALWGGDVRNGSVRPGRHVSFSRRSCEGRAPPPKEQRGLLDCRAGDWRLEFVYTASGNPATMLTCR